MGATTATWKSFTILLRFISIDSSMLKKSYSTLIMTKLGKSSSNFYTQSTIVLWFCVILCLVHCRPVGLFCSVRYGYFRSRDLGKRDPLWPRCKGCWASEGDGSASPLHNNNNNQNDNDDDDDDDEYNNNNDNNNVLTYLSHSCLHWILADNRICTHQECWYIYHCYGMESWHIYQQLWKKKRSLQAGIFMRQMLLGPLYEDSKLRFFQ